MIHPYSPTRSTHLQQAAAAAELKCATECDAFDAFITNDSFEEGYSSLKTVISRYRPDIIPPPKPKPTTGTSAADGATATTALASGTELGAAGSSGTIGGTKKRPHAPPLLLCGPAGGGREALAAQLLARLPGVFALPPRITDRKPGPGAGGGSHAAGGGGKGGGSSANASARESSTSGGGISGVGAAGAVGLTAPPEPEVVKADAFAKLAAAGQLVMQWQDGGGAQVGVTLEGLKATAAAGESGFSLVSTDGRAAVCARRGMSLPSVVTESASAIL